MVGVRLAQHTTAGRVAYPKTHSAAALSQMFHLGLLEHVRPDGKSTEIPDF
jgi:hypothetical protein